MELITLTLRKNHLWSAASVLGLAGLTYFTNRYMNNLALTNNKTYFKSIEVIPGVPNLNMLDVINPSGHITYIFWNGDMGSTYLLIDLLLQDKIIQPIYIERYTIIKELEKDKLENIAKHNDTLKDRKGQYKNKNNAEFLKSISKLKKSQEYEMKQIEMLRLMILGQYPEFRKNLLPTTYITTIAKDLEYTSKFYNALQESKPVSSYDGIELIEQIVRFLKYYDKLKASSSRIMLGCNKDYKNRDLLLNLIKKKIITIENIVTKDNITLDIPILDMDNKDVKFMAVEFFPNDIMKYFLQIEKEKF